MGAYRERLLVPVSYWLLAAPCVVVLGAEAYFFVDGWIPPLVIGLLAALVGTVLVHWSLATIEVTGPVLRAGGDTLALAGAGDVVALDEKQAARLRGPSGDPAAHLLLRPYLRRAVYVAIADPVEGGVPYWLIATRHPERLAAAISSARDGAAGADTDSSETGNTDTDETGTGSHQPAGRPSMG